MINLPVPVPEGASSAHPVVCQRTDQTGQDRTDRRAEPGALRDALSGTRIVLPVMHGDIGFVFCPQYVGKRPLRIGHKGEADRWLFGSEILPETRGESPDVRSGKTTWETTTQDLKLHPMPLAIPVLLRSILLEPGYELVPIDAVRVDLRAVDAGVFAHQLAIH